MEPDQRADSSQENQPPRKKTALLSHHYLSNTQILQAQNDNSIPKEGSSTDRSDPNIRQMNVRKISKNKINFASTKIMFRKNRSIVREYQVVASKPGQD